MDFSSPGWNTAALCGHRCQFFCPAKRHEHGFALIYLHDLEMTPLAEQEAFVQQFEQHGLVVVAPETGPSWWADRICPDFDSELTAERFLLDHVVAHLQQSMNPQPARIALLGIGMGGQGVLRFAYKYPRQFPVVAALNPAIDYQKLLTEGDETLLAMYADEEDVRQDTALLHVHPLNWPRHQFFASDPQDYRWWESADRLRMKLSSLGIPFEYDLDTSTGRSGFGYCNAMAETATSFLVERLEKERLSL